MAERDAVPTWRFRRLLPVVGLVTLTAATLAMTGPAVASGTPTGGACGYYTNVGFFGGPQTLRGCGQTIPPGDAGSASPSVTLPAGGSGTVISANDANGAIGAYGPAYIFSGQDANPPAATPPPSGALKATTTGTTKVTSTASVKNIGPGPLTATSITSKCTATTATKHTWTATVTGGKVATSTDSNGEPLTSVNVPSPTPKNYTVTGTITNVGDNFRIVFNEQLANGGAITANGAHMYLLGPTAVGDMIIAQSKCGH